jgi:uncharacterized protein (TIGR03067 family)
LAVTLVLAAPAFSRQPPAVVPPVRPNQSSRPELPPEARPTPPTASELPQLAGTWTITAGERSGQRLPDERVAGLRATITADTITIYDRANKPSYVIRYKLDTTRTPNELNMEIVDGPGRGQTAKGIVMMDSAEMMRLMYTTGGRGRPTEFRTLPGGATGTLFILKRAATDVLYAGNWRVADGEAGGKKLVPEQVQKTKVVMTADTLVLTDTFTNFTFVAKYKVDTSRVPNQIDMTVLEGANKGKTAHGIIAANGADGLRLCFATGGQRPTDFRTAAGESPSFCYKLQREPGPVGVQPGTIRAQTGPGESAPSGTPAGGVPGTTPPKP